MRRMKSNHLSSFQLLVIFYFSAVSISAILLSLPFAHKPGVEFSVMDGIFTAVSAVSVTGLTVVSIADTFSVAGTFVILIVIQIGGLGLMTMSTFIWILVGKKIGLKERQLIMADQNQPTLSGLVNLMKQILLLILTIEFIGFLILGTYYLTYFPTWQEAYYQALFATISATTNTGFDITGNSLLPFAHDYFVQFIHMVLIILGAIGFPVLIEIKRFFQHKKKSEPYRFSLFTKLTTSTYFILIAVGFLLILVLEWTHFFVGKSWHESFFYALFQSVTTRSSGLSTLDVSEFTLATQLILSVSMFIGASPSSVGGGIRTTTFAIVLLAIFFYAKGKGSIKVFNREIYEDDMRKAFVVSAVAVLLFVVAVIILSITEQLSLMPIIFEVASAFGTCGLSLGITPELSTIGKIVIMSLMFIGRIGLVTLVFLIRGKEITEKYHYPKERVIIG
ncbi:Ktr system potassium uptake protein D [Pueribacillus theae]|uniref:Ktr system potassium uptake protein D n=1 Tax=Pueribacillus theae TaxID=2171751 RepID=A0A2U1K2B6_9BACI|nr:Ktr system potassium uptake protein D [Pueribacillus theae]